jgi:peptidyl-prolyl cis-trans isomerase D
MLTQMRKGASSWPAKILLGLIALSFVGWGVGDIFINRGETRVAEVGSSEVDIRDLQLAYRNQVQPLQNSGVPVEQGSELAQALARLALDQLILRTLESNAARDMGITIDAETLRNDIAGNAAFFNNSGVFDPAVFQGVLATNGLSEARYLAILSNQISEGQFVNSIGAVPPPPSTLIDSVFGHRTEQRVVELAVIPNDKLVPLPTAETSDLRNYYEENLGKYEAPEYRSADYLLIYPDDLAETVEITEEAIQEAYANSAGAWTDPEQRRLQQIPFATEEEAVSAHQAIEGGADFAQVAFDEAGMEAEELELGWFTRADLFAELADPIFATPEGSVTAPLASPLGGWLLFRVAEIKPEDVTSFEDARETIESELRLRKARESIYGLANELDDQLAAGATVQETAQALDLNVKTVTDIDPDGTPEDPMSLQIIPTVPGFLDEVFFGELDFPSTVIETNDGGLLVVEVTEITPERLRPFDEVEEQVRQDWQHEELAAQAEEAAMALAQEVGSFGDVTEVFAETGASFDELQTFTRTQTPTLDNVGFETVTAVFAADAGAVVVSPSVDNTAQVVARILDVVETDALVDPDGYRSVEISVTNGMISDVIDQNSAAMFNATSIEIDERLLEQYF